MKTSWKEAWFTAGYAFCMLASLLNLNTLLFKVTPIIRGDLVGIELEYALLGAVLSPGIIIVALGMVCMNIRDHQKAYRDSLKEKKKCGKSCSTPG